MIEPHLKPEQSARSVIDQNLDQAGWTVQEKTKLTLTQDLESQFVNIQPRFVLLTMFFLLIDCPLV